MSGSVCCLGSINADITLLLDRLPERHEKIAARETMIGGGGSAANTAVWLARQGVKAKMLGWVGDDALGALALRDLQANGVETCGVRTLPVASPFAVCLSPPQDKRIIVSPVIEAEWTPYDALTLSEDDLWLHTTVCDVDFLMRAKGLKRKSALTISLEMDGRYDPLFARTANCLFTNHDELARRLGTSDPVGFIAKQHKHDAAIWFVTHGENGVVVVTGGEAQSVSLGAIEPVDRTGGGDAFNAGVVGALLAGANPRAAAAAGLKLAAQAISRLGAR